MGDFQLDSTVFSLRIVSLDYYMTPPIPGLDISHSSFHGGRANEVPVIRIYGSTPAGQKTCLHVHQVLPYLYIPSAVLGCPADDTAIESHMHALLLGLENAIKLKGNGGSKRQHVHACCVVRAKKFYGYHASEEAFVKILFYHPQDIPRAANLLLTAAVFDKVIQPYESHIPYLLQFLIDYNLYGMSHLHLSKMMFRYPIPDGFSPRRAKLNALQRSLVDDSANIDPRAQDDAGGNKHLNGPIWTSLTIPDGWIWRDSHYPDSFVNEDVKLFDRESTCELEGDALVDDILNQQFISHAPLSQSHSEVKMVQSLVPIWEDEVQRNGVPDVVPPDPGKPLPKDVLKTLSDEVQFRKLTETVNAVERYLATESTQSSTGSGDLVATRVVNGSTMNLISKNLKTSQSSLNTTFQNVNATEVDDIDAVAQQQLSFTMVSSSGTATDEDAMRILKWFACSEAADDINSDDELTREIILSPLIPDKNIDKMLEKANANYESESQQECQDILDSVDMLYFKESNPGSSTENVALSTKTIPQVDGSNDVLEATSCADKLKKADGGEATPSLTVRGRSEIDSSSSSSSSSSCQHGRKRPRWGCLPISGQKVNDVLCPRFVVSDESDYEKLEGSGTSVFEDEVERFPFVRKIEDVSMEKTSTMVESSTRDLMRKKRKRSHRIELSEGKGQVEDWNAMSCYDGGCGGGTYSCAKLNNDFGDKKSFLPMNKHPLRNEKAKCHGTKINSTLEVGTESNNDKAISSCVLDPNFLQCSMMESTVIGNTPKNAYHEFVADTNLLERNSVASCRPSMFNNFEKSAYHERHSGFSKHVDLTLDNVKDVESADLIGMTLSVKPPTSEWVDEPERGALLSSGDVESGKLLLQSRSADDYLPFFTRNCLEERTHEEHADLGRVEFDDHPESVIGVPVLRHNDGAYLFMLTLSVSPPSRESVDKWLLEKDAVSPSWNMTRKCSSEIADTEGPGADFAAAPLLDSSLLSNERPNLHRSYQHNPEPCSLEARSRRKTQNNLSTCCLQDISQISGPDKKTTLTPLSQIGFRDPASVGGGQQLTLLSIEVQAESRGELRPDPRFDAINAIVLVFQEDDESQDAQVLLRSDSSFTRKDLDAVSECEVLVFTEELDLFKHFAKVIQTSDPDVIMGWDVQSGSLGILAERAAHLGFGLLNCLSRTPLKKTDVPSQTCEGIDGEKLTKSVAAEAVLNDTIIEDEWGRTHASGVRVVGRIVLNLWRLMRNEVKLNMYTVEAVAEAVLRRKVPYIPWKVLAKWFTSGPGCARYRCINYILERAKLNLQIMNQLDVINRTSELARVFGIDFFSVLSRGSQYRVESMFLRLAHTQNYLAISPSSQQVANQPAMECLPLVMEPESGFYEDPVIVLDFQSLYPSMVIGYNLCFCTCLGKIEPPKTDTLGVTSYSPDIKILHKLKDELLVTPNGVVYVPSNIRQGILPRLLEEILSTRIMVKQAMKKLGSSELVLHRIFNARQLALKLIANVTYGYTAAAFSGRMPCAELADSIVQCGRRTLENAISFVNSNIKWRARVIYGDTDSMFVLLKGRSLEEALTIGREIASVITEMNPKPVTLKMEKVYYPCFLLTKKRYVGYSYESPDQRKPVFDAKGIETVRRDTCGAVSKIMERSLRAYFEDQNMDEVKLYIQRQWTRILSGRISLQDFIFAKEVRLGTYSSRASSLPPAAIVATKAMRADPRAEPRYAERIPYVVVHGEPGSRLVDMVVEPLEILAINSPFRLNGIYYIRKQIIPALQRVFGLVGADLNKWFLDMPRPERESVGKHHPLLPNLQRTRIDYYYISKHCILCGDLVQASESLCDICLQNESTVATALIGRTAKLEKDIQHLTAICWHCGGVGDWRIENGVKCVSLACSVFYERMKVQKQLHTLSQVYPQNDLYPNCMIEWF